MSKALEQAIYEAKSELRILREVEIENRSGYGNGSLYVWKKNLQNLQAIKEEQEKEIERINKGWEGTVQGIREMAMVQGYAIADRDNNFGKKDTK